MFDHISINNRWERWLVGTADVILRVPTAVISRVGRRPIGIETPRRILLLRLERVGDLIMVLDAIAMVRKLAPNARIDLVVGTWNEALARLIPDVDAVETLDVPWMARQGHGRSWPALFRRAWRWRTNRYDLAINFEGDIRSNLLLALSGALRRIGYVNGGGGPVLTDSIADDRKDHVAANAARLVNAAFERVASDSSMPDGARQVCRLRIPEEARQRAAALLAPAGDSEFLIGIQPAAGRQIREWDPGRFGAVAAELSRMGKSTFVLAGSANDRPQLAAVKATWPSDLNLIELPVDTDLVVLAAILERLTLFITGDTGPMHLAAAVGTPIVAIFGPSLPSRYAPLSSRARIVRIDLPCSPCNLLRQPPARCVGHVPDCLAGIEPFEVVQAARELLGRPITRWTVQASRSS